MDKKYWTPWMIEARILKHYSEMNGWTDLFKKYIKNQPKKLFSFGYSYAATRGQELPDFFPPLTADSTVSLLLDARHLYDTSLHP